MWDTLLDTKTHHHESWKRTELEIRIFLGAEICAASSGILNCWRRTRSHSEDQEVRCGEKVRKSQHLIENNNWPWIKWSVDIMEFKFWYDSETKSWFIIIYNYHSIFSPHNITFTFMLLESKVWSPGMQRKSSRCMSSMTATVCGTTDKAMIPSRRQPLGQLVFNNVEKLWSTVEQIQTLRALST